jgi:hypothetical protein
VGLGRRKRSRGLRPGDVVEVRSPAEILATLDERAATENVPFMPEMLRFAGQRFTVSRRVEKICDTVGKVTGEPSVSRRMRRTVYLEDLRCDGSGHGGCQAGCRLYWKEAWLRLVEAGTPAAADGDGLEALAALAEDATTAMREVGNGSATEVFRCQATEARIASEPLAAIDPRQHVREIAAGNVSAAHVVSVLGRYGFERAVGYARMTASRTLSALHLHSPRPDRAGEAEASRGPTRSDGIQPGDVVRIRPLEEIERTLVAGRHRGLWFDAPEMGTFCGGTFTVKDRVRRIIDERSGEMIELKSDCLILDGVCCTGEHSSRRWFCPRRIYSYWREDWLELVQKAPAPTEREVAASR